MTLGGGGVYWRHQWDFQAVGENLCPKFLPDFSSHLNETSTEMS